MPGQGTPPESQCVAPCRGAVLLAAPGATGTAPPAVAGNGETAAKVAVVSERADEADQFPTPYPAAIPPAQNPRHGLPAAGTRLLPMAANCPAWLSHCPAGHELPAAWPWYGTAKRSGRCHPSPDPGAAIVRNHPWLALQFADGVCGRDGRGWPAWWHGPGAGRCGWA